jgi:hypothetical protein
VVSLDRQPVRDLQSAGLDRLDKGALQWMKM